MKEFNARQRQAVRDIGMTGILGLEITHTPLTLGRWLVSNFMPMDCSLQLRPGRIVEITREDVAATVSLPLDDRMQCFTGPLLSLMMFYIDRVVVGDCVILRGIPAFVGWTSKLLREQEVAKIRGGGFGMGTLDIPLRETVNGEENGSGDQFVRRRSIQVGLKEAHGCLLLTDFIVLKGFVERFAEKSKLLAATVVELVQMVKDAPEHTYNDINFKVVLEAAEKLLGMTREGIQAPVQPCTQHDDSFWANPDNIAVVEEIENAIVMKQGLMDRPSFSLGLTQTPVVSPGRGVQDIVVGCIVVRNGGCPFGLVDGVIQDEATVDGVTLQVLRCCTESLSDTIAIAQLKTPLKVAQPHSKASLKVGDDAWDMPSFSLGLTQSPVVLPTENVQKSGMDCTVARPTECSSCLKVGAVQFAIMVNPPLLGKIEGYAVSLQKPSCGLISSSRAIAVAQQRAPLKVVQPHSKAPLPVGESDSVIECWVCVLNEKEKYKRAYSPSRFFVSALTSIHTIVPATTSRERRLRWFVKRLDGNFDIAPHINRCTVDLKDLLSSYLEKKGHPVRAATVRNLKPTRLRIGWRDCQNNVDCAVYAMRHMKTFMGRPHSRWDCDLENGNR
nr:uncharacterized protein LOC109174777 [Ipomoea batatas]